MIQTFEELIEIAQVAKSNRLDEITYRRIVALNRENAMLARHYGAPSIKGILVKFPLLRRIKRILLGGEDQYLFACTYSDVLLADFKDYRDEYMQSYRMLSDDWSRQLFVNLLAGEMLMDSRYGIPFQQCKLGGVEYYCLDLPGGTEGEEPFICAGEIMVDCGAYIGDTLREFIDEGKTPKKYFGFEPNPDNFRKAQQTLIVSSVAGVIHRACVSKSSGVMCFSGRGGTGKITEGGELSIDALSLDDVIKEPVTLIKMDIEGGEYEALEGAASLIGTYKPKLAICIYHKPTDFRRIPLLIKRLNSEYSQFYIRYLSAYYTGRIGFHEVVLYVS